MTTSAAPQADHQQAEARPADPTPSALAPFVDALGVLWSTAQLYPQPEEQTIYQRALEQLQTEPLYPVKLEVGPGHFMDEGEPVRARREGADRLARQLFVHDITLLVLRRPPTAEEMTALLRTVAADDEDIRAGGGIQAVLGDAGGGVIELRARTELVEGDGTWTEDLRASDVVAVMESGQVSRQVAAELVGTEGQSEDEVAETFLDRYSGVYAKVDETDLTAREDIVMAFVDTYFYLPTGNQVALLGRMLERREEDYVQFLLDQFSGHDLARLAPMLDTVSRESLQQYARIASDLANNRPDELLTLLQTSSEVVDARKAISERVTSILDSEAGAIEFGEAFANLERQRHDIDMGTEVAVDVILDLLSVEDRSVRVKRILRIWASRVSSAVKERDFDLAERWLSAVMDHDIVDGKHTFLLERVFVDLLSDEMVESVLADHSEEAAPVRRRLLDLWGTAAVDSLVERLAVEEDAGKRRELMDLTTLAATDDPKRLFRHLADGRWYVVRNLAMVLGRVDDEAVVTRLEGLLGHDDHRVRVEALRALIKQQGLNGISVAIRMLGDEHERVREATAAMLRTWDEPRVDQGLVSAVHSPDLPFESVAEAVAVLAARGTPAARSEVDRLAAPNFALGRARRLRKVARDVRTWEK